MLRCKKVRSCLRRAEDLATKDGDSALLVSSHLNISMRTQSILDIVASFESSK